MANVSQLGYFQKSTGKREVKFPRLPLYSALALLGFTIAAVLFGQTTGIGTIKNNFGKPAAIRDIVLTQSTDDVVRVLDAKSGQEIAAYGANEGGFVRGSLRALERMRFVTKTPLTTPYRLIKWENGAISLSDTSSGERLYLDAFGKDNSAAFEAFLNFKTAKPTQEKTIQNVTLETSMTTGELTGGVKQ